MGTDGDLEYVADAADPGPEVLLPDLERGEPGPASEPPDVEAERHRAVEHAARHVERVRRREARRARAVDSEWGATPLVDARFCSIDLETTGARAGGGDDILEVGAVRVRDVELEEEFASLVRPLRPISAAAQAVHGIEPADVAAAPPIATVLPFLLEMVRDRVLVFHNASFDLGFLQRALVESERRMLALPVVDTLVVARRLVGGRCGLGSVAARLGVPGPHPHRALGDARLTARLLVALLDILRRGGASKLGDIPGIRARAPRPRVRRVPRPDPLVHRLESAIACGEALRVAYRAGRGMAAHEIRLRPLVIQSGTCVALDLDRQVELEFDLARVDRVLPAH